MAATRLAPAVAPPLLAAILGIVSIRFAEAQPGGPPGEMGLEALTRGSVHEGFGQPLAFDAAPGEVVSVQPPAPIDEMLPEYRLHGKKVGWMPGYWSWDDHQGKFVWTSGFWRVWPADRDYVPGYWQRVEGGWRRIVGFWTPAGTQKIHYYPAPPKNREAGSATPPPSADHIWLPGRYVWKDHGFVWHKGYWAKAQLGWVWIPPHHVWTPAGVVYVTGYWDYPVDRRALLFAPVAISPDVLDYPNFQFRPRVVIDAEILLDHLFCRVLGCHYCFGDYYASSGDGSGIYPWFAFHLAHGYDPLYAYYSWLRGREDPGWQARLASSYRYRSDHEEARPTETFFEQRAQSERHPSADMEHLALGRSLQDMAVNGDRSLQLTPKSGPRPGGDAPRAGPLTPIALPFDRADAEARLAALRADPANADKVLVWELPLSALARQAEPAAEPASSPPLVQPGMPIRPSTRETAPNQTLRRPTLRRFRRYPPESLDATPLLQGPLFGQPLQPDKPRRFGPQVPSKQPAWKGAQPKSPHLLYTPRRSSSAR